MGEVVHAYRYDVYPRVLVYPVPREWGWAVACASLLCGVSGLAAG